MCNTSVPAATFLISVSPNKDLQRLEDRLETFVSSAAGLTSNPALFFIP
jgi:hypothetical protein